MPNKPCSHRSFFTRNQVWQCVTCEFNHFLFSILRQPIFFLYQITSRNNSQCNLLRVGQLFASKSPHFVSHDCSWSLWLSTLAYSHPRVDLPFLHLSTWATATKLLRHEAWNTDWFMTGCFDGLFKSPHNWVGFHPRPLYTAGFLVHCLAESKITGFWNNRTSAAYP